MKQQLILCTILLTISTGAFASESEKKAVEMKNQTLAGEMHVDGKKETLREGLKKKGEGHNCLSCRIKRKLGFLKSDKEKK